MAIGYGDVKYNVGKIISSDDPAANGGGIGDLIATDELNSIFPEITATERENGIIVRRKVFITNKSADRTMKDNLISIGQDVLPPEQLRMYEATEKTKFYASLDNDIDGATSTVAAGTEIAISLSSRNETTTADMVDRRIKMDGNVLTVDTAPTVSSITLKEDINVLVSAGTLVTADDVFDSVESEESYVDANAFINSVVKSTFQNGSSTVGIVIADKPYFPIGRSIVILDGYYRILMRATVTDIQDDAGDATKAVVTLSKTYSGAVTLPSNNGFIAGAIKKTIVPDDTASVWMELIVSPNSSIDSEAINQFQLSSYFDDVTA